MIILILQMKEEMTDEGSKTLSNSGFLIFLHLQNLVFLDRLPSKY